MARYGDALGQEGTNNGETSESRNTSNIENDWMGRSPIHRGLDPTSAVVPGKLLLNQLNQAEIFKTHRDTEIFLNAEK